MALAWLKEIKPAVRKAGSTAVKMTAKERVAANMDKALAAAKAGEQGQRPTIKRVGDDVVFSVRFANQKLLLDGANGEFTVPADKFESVYAAIKASVLAGEFDKQLEPMEEATVKRGAAMAAAKAKKK